MSVSRGIMTYVFWSILACLVLAGGVVIFVNHFRRSSPVKTLDVPIPPISKSRYLNTGPDAHYIGINACAECHKTRHDSYLLTAHSKALDDLDPANEPPDGSFHHKLSGRHYEVYRKDGKFYHKETLAKDKDNPLFTTELPIKYVVGSGFVTRSYVVEVDGFLHESPITWYTQSQKWHMSPGYDQRKHHGFERQIDAGCLSCHTGRVENLEGGVHRLKILEQEIGCESCHGPGSLHRDWHTAKKPINGLHDLTIVNPVKLPRHLGEAICANCHLRGEATVFLRGRKLGDFRPGLPLTDFRVDYQFENPDKSMKVVGHVEQMHLSECYKNSATLTCITCHDPHANAAPKDPVAFYKKKCFACHDHDSCGLEHSERLKKDPKDNCLACHMPNTGTDIPHIAFTHHRIGVHKSNPEIKMRPLLKLAVMEDNPGLSAIDQNRNLGLAYTEASYNQEQPNRRNAYRSWGLQLLESIEKNGLKDGHTKEALARLIWKKNPRIATNYAKQALKFTALEPTLRANALLIIAHNELKAENSETAINFAKQLTEIRRHSEDWYLLGLSYLKQKQLKKAAHSLKYSLSINPFRPEIHQLLAEVYGQLGQSQLAQQHKKAAQLLATPS